METGAPPMGEGSGVQAIPLPKEESVTDSSVINVAAPLTENQTETAHNAAQPPTLSEPHEETLQDTMEAGKHSSDFVLEPLKVSPSSEELFGAGELSENFQTRGVRVVVRCRPLLAHERDHEQQCMTLDKESKSVTLQSSKNVDERMRHFFFDDVLDEGCSQQEAFTRVQMGPMVESVLAGYHATVFCYGQTGSGKTHTMEGFTYRASRGATSPKAQLDTDPQQLGLIARSISLLFESIKRKKKAEPHVTVNVKCSMVQIYKEQVYDLLNPTLIDPGAAPFSTTSLGRPLARPPQQVLKVRWNRRREFYLENVFEFQCTAADEALEHFRFGVNNKTMASHKMNMASSRSHSLFTVIVETAPASAPEDAIVSKLCLVDLAGYERSAQSGSTSGQLQQESIFINKSLFTLRKVITSLADPHYRGLHVPYRDSKLTCLLKHSLGGNSLTLMIACVAPSDAYWEDNLSTLEYASKTKQISNQVAVNEDPKNRLIRLLRERVLFLEHQLAALTVSPVFSQGGDWVGTPTWQPHAAAQDSAVLTNFSTARTPVPAAALPADAQREAAAAGDPRPEKVVEQVRYEIRSESVDELEMGKRLVASVDYIKKVLASNEELRAAVGKEHASNEALQSQNTVLMEENQDLRERLGVLESVVVMEDEERKAVASISAETDAGSGPSSAQARSGPEYVLTAGSAALLELIDLRKENKELREMVRRWETGTQFRGNTRARSRSPTKPASGAQRAFKSQTHTSEHRERNGSFRRNTDNTGAESPYSPKHARAVKSAAGLAKRGTREAKEGDGLMTLEELRGVLSGGGSDVSVTSQSGRQGSPLRVSTTGRLLADVKVGSPGTNGRSSSKIGTAPSSTWATEGLTSSRRDERRFHTSDGRNSEEPGKQPTGILPAIHASLAPADTSSALAQLSELIRTRNELTKNHTRLPAYPQTQ